MKKANKIVDDLKKIADKLNLQYSEEYKNSPRKHLEIKSTLESVSREEFYNTLNKVFQSLEKSSSDELKNYHIILEKDKTTKSLIKMPPGYIFSNMGKVIFTKKSYERVVEPAITMMQEEYFEAYSQKRYSMAHWIKIRFFFIFVQILLINMPLVSALLELKEKFTSK